MKKLLLIPAMLFLGVTVAGCNNNSGDSVNCKSDPFNAACQEDKHEASGTEDFYDGPTIDLSYLNKKWENFSGALKKVTLELDFCIDGDTSNFKDSSNNEYRVRYLGIDTPETNPNGPSGVEPWGIAAKDYTCSLLTGVDAIYLQLDTSSTVNDTYDRTLAWVWVKNGSNYTLVNYMVMKKGFSADVNLNSKLMFYKYIEGAKFYAKSNSLRAIGNQIDPNYTYPTNR